MVCTANELIGWKDFPKGLKVLLLDEDINSATEIRSKLEEMDYIVSIFSNEKEALSAISSKSQIFHVAIVEVKVSPGNNEGSFTFLENAKDLPTIMTSNIHCLNTMMKCIAHGAVEFLQKPLSEDKLRNIWQHVAHKAFNAVGSGVVESLKPVKEDKEEFENQILSETEENVTELHELNLEQSSEHDKYPAPTTPQCENVVMRSLDDDGESKSVETTCGNSNETVIIKEEDKGVDESKSESNLSPHPPQKKGVNDIGDGAKKQNKVPDNHNSCATRSNRKKMKVDWTPELHKTFVHAVEKLGVDQAIPSRILEMMKVQGLTRHNVASHLQKYRMHRRHILPKEGDRRLSHPRDAILQRGYYQHKPVMAYPSYPTWGPPGGQRPVLGDPMWSFPGYAMWQSPDNWLWNSYPTMHADVWGCPVMPPPYSHFPQNADGYQNFCGVDNDCCISQNSFQLHPEEEIIDKVVKEAISKPWLPLPLGLKPPSTESVLTALSRQGVPNIPPHSLS